MIKKGFTLVEVVIVVVVVGVLATIGFPVYQNIVGGAKAKVCETNLKALQTALDLYAINNDSIPASLSMIPREYIREAYNRVLNNSDSWKIKIAFIITDWKERGLAHASFLAQEIAKGNISIITCPIDEDPPSEGGISYGMNSALADMSSDDYRALGGGMPVIADCESDIFDSPDDFAQRHKRYNFVSPVSYYQAVTKSGVVVNNLGNSTVCPADNSQCSAVCTGSDNEFGGGQFANHGQCVSACQSLCN